MSVCFLFIASATTAVRTADLQHVSDAERAAKFVPLFNGRDLTGWETQHRDDWLVHDRAIYCTGQRSTLKYTAKKLPSDFELRFRWRADRPRLFAGLIYAGSDGAVCFYKRHDDFVDNRVKPPHLGLGKSEGIQYGMATSKLCVTAVADKMLGPRPDSMHTQYLESLAGGDFERPQGDWNDGMIRCEGSRIECRHNGGVVFQQDLSGEAAAKWAAGEISGDWLAAKQPGLELTIDCERSPIWVRDIRLADFTQAASAQRIAAPAK